MKKGPIMPHVHTANQVAPLSECNGFSSHKWGFSEPQNLQFYFFTNPFKWKCALSTKQIHQIFHYHPCFAKSTLCCKALVGMAWSLLILCGNIRGLFFNICRILECFKPVSDDNNQTLFLEVCWILLETLVTFSGVTYSMPEFRVFHCIIIHAAASFEFGKHLANFFDWVLI